MDVSDRATYFIYLHRRLDSGAVFYVGKGTRTKKRAYARAFKTQERNRFWVNVATKARYTVELFADFFKEEDALEMEIELIAQYKRKCAGGTLVNLSTGGEGVSGYVPTAEHRAKISLAHKRRPSSPEQLDQLARMSTARIGVPLSAEHKAKLSAAGKGKSLSTEHRAKISTAKKGRGNGRRGQTHSESTRKKMVMSNPHRRRVLDSSTGTVYESIGVAATASGHSKSTLHTWLSGVRPNPTTMRYAQSK